MSCQTIVAQNGPMSNVPISTAATDLASVEATKG